MAKITITEALAELKTIDARIVKKQEFVMSYLLRQEALKDPLERDGGSVASVGKELQAIRDLHERQISIRREINAANMRESVAINGTARTLGDWIIWKREVAPKQQTLYAGLTTRVTQVRNEFAKRGAQVIGGNVENLKPTDVVVNLNEKELALKIEELESTLGALDGQLSLKNATLTIDV